MVFVLMNEWVGIPESKKVVGIFDDLKIIVDKLKTYTEHFKNCATYDIDPKLGCGFYIIPVNLNEERLTNYNVIESYKKIFYGLDSIFSYNISDAEKNQIYIEVLW